MIREKFAVKFVKCVESSIDTIKSRVKSRNFWSSKPIQYFDIALKLNQHNQNDGYFSLLNLDGC